MFLVCVCVLATPADSQDKDDEIVATLTGGRVIVHATRESVTFIAIDEPIEAGSAPPRVMTVDGRHVAVLLGSSEWRIPADPNPIRLDKGYTRVGATDSRYQGSYGGEAEPDLETTLAARRAPASQAGFSSGAAAIRIGDYRFRSEGLRPGSLDRGISHDADHGCHAGRLLANTCAAAALHANLSPRKTCAAETSGNVLSG